MAGPFQVSRAAAVIRTRCTRALTAAINSLHVAGKASLRARAAAMPPLPVNLGRPGASPAPGPALRAPGVPLPGWGPRPAQALALLIALLLPAAALAVPAGTVITNTAQADYTIASSPGTSYSNSVSLTTTVIGTQAVMGLFAYSPSAPSLWVTVTSSSWLDTVAGSWQPSGPPVHPTLGPVALPGPVPLAPASVFVVGEPVFVVLTDPDPNQDPAVADTVTVTVTLGGGAETEVLLLIETGPDTGVFTSYVVTGSPVGGPYDGTLGVSAGGQATATYVDPTDLSDLDAAAAVFDPAGILFAVKESGRSAAAMGDFVPFAVTVTNNSADPVSALVVNDLLPAGFRYRKGSCRIDGAGAPDPAVSPDGRSLSFSVGDLPAGAAVQVSYIAAVGVGVMPGTVRNVAVASAGLLVSNAAAASLRITRDLFAQTAFVAGQVVIGACGEQPAEGLEGARVILEDGTFAVTDRHGRYHLEGVVPGAHVLALDPATVPPWYEVVDCEDGTRSAGRAASRFLDLQGGTLWRVDFNLVLRPREEGKAILTLASEADANGARYTAGIKGQSVPIRKVRFTVVLPEGIEYVRGTSRLEGVTIADPAVDGNSLLWDLGDLPGNQEKGVTFETRIREGWEWTTAGVLGRSEEPDAGYPQKSVQGRMRQVYSRAFLTFDTHEAKDVQTPVVDNLLMRVAEEASIRDRKFIFRPHFATFEAQLTDEDKVALDIIAKQFDPKTITSVQVTGHTDDVPISGRGQRIHPDNYALSLARARSVALYLAGAWGLSSSDFIVKGMGPDQPIDGNDTEQGRAVNRRVEVGVITSEIERRTSIEPVMDYSATEVQVVGLRPGQGGEEKVEEIPAPAEPPDPTRDLGWLESEAGSLRWVMPDEGFLPAQPGLKVAVVHGARTSVSLLLNGAEVNPLNFDSRTRNTGGTASMSFWRGVHMNEGDNTIIALEKDGEGREVARITRSVHYSGPPTKAELVPSLSSLTADGRTEPVLAVRLTDQWGYPARRGIIGQFDVREPYQSLEQAEMKSRRPSDRTGRTYSNFRVGSDGVALLKLKPTSMTGEVRVSVNLSGGWRQVDAVLAPEMRDWIVVGLAEGTAGYSVVSGNMEALEGAGAEEDLYTDGRVALYAKGRVRGRYLMTLAYDTRRESGVNGGQLGQTVDPDAYYTLYGDGSEQDHDAASTSKLYLKLEREQFYALFGDFDTGLTETELGRYSRTLTGFKSEMTSRGFAYEVFASQSGQSFIRDEIPGDGTSGLYHMSSGDVLPNSEKVRIEVRDRFRSERIVSSVDLVRHVDYNVDYLEGTVFFKEPVPQRDAGFNPVYVVIDYETEDSARDPLIYGGRGSVKVGGSSAELGVTAIREERGQATADLAAVDLTAELTERTRVRAEAAASASENPAAEADGRAYLARVEHDGDRFKASAYLREQEGGFGLGQQNASESGFRKAGADMEYSVKDGMRLKASVSDQLNLETDARRQVQEAGLEAQVRQFGFRAGARRARDVDSSGDGYVSSQLLAGASYGSADGKFRLRADHDQSLGSGDNGDYPTRTTLGADYRLRPAVSLYAEQEFTDGRDASTAATRAGVKANPWQGGEATGSVSSRSEENSERLYASLGMKQSLEVSETWKVSAGLEHGEVLSGSSSAYAPVNPSVLPASGGEDYTALSLGTDNRFGLWHFNARLEARDSQSAEKWGVISDLFGEPKEGVGLSASLRWFELDSVSGEDRTDGSLRLGLAYRPLGSRWILLDRLENIVEEQKGAGAGLVSRRLVNNLNANYRPDQDSQVSFHSGIKHARDTIDGQSCSGMVYLLGAEARHDLARRWDLGGHASVLHSGGADQTLYGLGMSLGWSFISNAWMSFGYNLLGFVDEDFSDGEFTAQGPYVKLRIRFDQDDLRSMLGMGKGEVQR